MHSLGSISAIASGKKIFLYFPIWSCVNTCGGGHLGFQIITKNTNLIRDHSMIIHAQNGFIQLSSFLRKRIVYICIGSHLGFQIDIKKTHSNLVKDLPMIIHVQFGFSQFISFREEEL
jgi:hypothetical protein